MASIGGKKALQALLRKGFTEANNKSGDHIWLEFWHDGKLTRARTKFSHNGQDLDDFLIRMVSKQICLSKDEFKKYVECTISQQNYIDILKSKSFL
jgi:hypothetical protein